MNTYQTAEPSKRGPVTPPHKEKRKMNRTLKVKISHNDAMRTPSLQHPNAAVGPGDRCDTYAITDIPDDVQNTRVLILFDRTCTWFRDREQSAVGYTLKYDELGEGAIVDHPSRAWTPDALKSLRASLGLSQEAAARQIGVTTSTWARWEQGVFAPSAYKVIQGLEALAKSCNDSQP